MTGLIGYLCIGNVYYWLPGDNRVHMYTSMYTDTEFLVIYDIFNFLSTGGLSWIMVLLVIQGTFISNLLKNYTPGIIHIYNFKHF